ncbi:MAG: hypothetical protein FWG68_03410, partial [Defluviitaleaceae bacterium]|nr:hypothetical protein [Defluviitaleaceae bacterium]
RTVAPTVGVFVGATVLGRPFSHPDFARFPVPSRPFSRPFSRSESLVYPSRHGFKAIETV